jgi:excisionase family DNA binding protein
MVHSGALSIEEFCSRYGIGRTTVYSEIKAGRLKAVKVGRRTLVPDHAGEAWLRSLPQATATKVA